MCLDKSNHEGRYSVSELQRRRSCHTPAPHTLTTLWCGWDGSCYRSYDRPPDFYPASEFATTVLRKQTDVQALFRNSQSKNREWFFRNEIAALYSDIRFGYSTWADHSTAPTMVSNAKRISDLIFELNIAGPTRGGGDNALLVAHEQVLEPGGACGLHADEFHPERLRA